MSFREYDEFLGLGRATPTELRHLRDQTARGVARREDEVSYMRQYRMLGIDEKQKALDWHKGALSAIEQELARRGVKGNPRAVPLRKNHHIRQGGEFYTPAGRKGTALGPAKQGFYPVRWKDGTFGRVRDTEKDAYPTEGSRTMKRVKHNPACRGVCAPGTGPLCRPLPSRRNPPRVAYDVEYVMYGDRRVLDWRMFPLPSGPFWSKQAAEATARKLKRMLKADGYVKEAATVKAVPRGATSGERLARVAGKAKTGKYEVWSKFPGSDAQVEARFSTKKRAEIWVERAQRVDPSAKFWIESPGSIERKLHRLHDQYEEGR